MNVFPSACIFQLTLIVLFPLFIRRNGIFVNIFLRILCAQKIFPGNSKKKIFELHSSILPANVEKLSNSEGCDVSSLLD